MLLVLSMLAAFAAALCYGVSSVLQKIGADTQKKATSLDPGLLVRLTRNIPYVSGTTLDLLAWPLSVVAVHYLPLFVAEPIISLSVIMTVIVERIVFKHTVSRKTVAAIAIVGAGLMIIASQAHAETARQLTGTDLWLVVAGGPLLIAVFGVFAAQVRGRFSAFFLAIGAGSAFGGSAIVSRDLQILHPLWHSLLQPPLYASAIYGIIAVLLFTIALQRTEASIVNATVVGMETIVPTFVGIILLGDTTRSGSYILLIAGTALTIIGTVAVSLSRPARKARPRRPPGKAR